MKQEQIKEQLLQLYNTNTEFSVTLTGKSSSKINGLYKPATHEILLHNKNFKSDNKLIYTAIHEYAHHVVCCHSPTASTRSHSVEFWATFHDLLDTAEKKGIYELITGNNKEKLTELIEGAKKIEAQIAELEKDLSVILGEIYKLCQDDESIRYEDVIDRKLQISRTSVDRICSSAKLPKEVPADIKKVIAKIKNPEKRTEAVEMYASGKSPAQIRFFAANKNTVPSSKNDNDKEELLQKEKSRLEKTIFQLNLRLEKITAVLEKIESEIDLKQKNTAADYRK